MTAVIVGSISNYSSTMQFIHHKYNKELLHQKDKIKFVDDNGVSMRLCQRRYNNQLAFFYMDSHIYSRLFIYSGDFINQLHDYCMEIKSKCSNKSIRSAFSDSPNLCYYILEGTFYDCHIDEVSIGGVTNKCLAVDYLSIILPKKMMYKRLAKMEETLREEIKKVKKDELRGKWDTLKKIGATILKTSARVGVALAAGAVGANLDFDPDIDFGDSTPNIDFGNVDFGNVDFGNVDFGNVDFGNVDLGDVDLGDVDMGGIQSDGLAFGARIDGGQYLDTGKDITVYGETGGLIGNYDVVLHNGQKGIIKDGTWLKLIGDRIGAHYYTKG